MDASFTSCGATLYTYGDVALDGTYLLVVLLEERFEDLASAAVAQSQPIAWFIWTSRSKS